MKLVGRVEIDEDDGVFGQAHGGAGGRVIGDVRGRGRHEGIGQVDARLAALSRQVRRRVDRIGDQPRDVIRPQRRAIAEVVGLYRRRFEGEHFEARIARMPGEIDKDLDAIVVDAARGLGERHAAHIAKRIERRFKFAGGGIALRRVERIAEPFEFVAVVGLEQAAKCDRHTVVAKIG